MEESIGAGEVIARPEKKISQEQKDRFLGELAGKGLETSAFAWAFADGTPPTSGFRQCASNGQLRVFLRSLPDSIGAEEGRVGEENPIKPVEGEEIVNQVFTAFRGEFREVFDFQEDFLRQIFENDPQLVLVQDFFQQALWLVEAVNGARQKPISWQKAQVMAAEEMTKIYGPGWNKDPDLNTRLQRQKEKLRRAFRHEIFTTEAQPTALSDQEQYLYTSLESCCETLISKIIIEEVVASYPLEEEVIRRKPFLSEVSGGAAENEPILVSKEEFKRLKIKPDINQDGIFCPEFITPEDDKVYFVRGRDGEGNYSFSNSGYPTLFQSIILRDNPFSFANSANYCRKKMVNEAFKEVVSFYCSLKKGFSLNSVVNIARHSLAETEMAFLLDGGRDEDIFPLSSSISWPRRLRDLDRLAVWKIIADVGKHGAGYLAEKALFAQGFGRPKPEDLWRGKKRRQNETDELSLDLKPEMRNLTESEFKERGRILDFVLTGRQKDLAKVSGLVVSNDLPGKSSEYCLPSDAQVTVALESAKQLTIISRKGFLTIPTPVGFDLASLKISADGRELSLSKVKIYSDSVSGQYRVKLPRRTRRKTFSITAGFQPAREFPERQKKDLAVSTDEASKLVKLLESHGLGPIALVIRKKIGKKSELNVSGLTRAIRATAEYSFDGKTAQGRGLFQKMASLYDPSSGKYQVQCGSQALFLSACLKFVFKGSQIKVGTESLYSLEGVSILPQQEGGSILPVTGAVLHARTVLSADGVVYRYDATPPRPAFDINSPKPEESRILKIEPVEQPKLNLSQIEEYTEGAFKPLIGELEALADRYYHRQEPTKKSDPDLRLYQIVEKLSQSGRLEDLKKALDEVIEIEQLAEALLEKHQTGEIAKIRLPPRFKKPTFALQFRTLVKSVRGRIYAAAA